MTVAFDPQLIASRLACARRDMVNRLEAMDEAARLATMFDACIETGGSFVPHCPAIDNTSFAEIQCLGIYHSGDDMPEAISGWIKAVKRSIAPRDPVTGVAA